MKKVLIGGIGNVLLGDDGVGPYVARLLAAMYEFEKGVEVADLGTPALDLIDRVSGQDAVILIDSVKVDAAPGTVVLYRKADIMRQGPAVRMDPHSPALVDTLYKVELFGSAPDNVLLIGVAGASYQTGCSLTARVSASVTQVLAEILRELARLGVGCQSRQQPLDPDIWWIPIGEAFSTSVNW